MVREHALSEKVDGRQFLNVAICKSFWCCDTRSSCCLSAGQNVDRVYRVSIGQTYELSSSVRPGGDPCGSSQVMVVRSSIPPRCTLLDKTVWSIKEERKKTFFES